MTVVLMVLTTVIKEAEREDQSMMQTNEPCSKDNRGESPTSKKKKSTPAKGNGKKREVTKSLQKEKRKACPEF